MLEAAIFSHIALGIVQGLTEFLPISSSGHLILTHQLLGSVGDFDLAFDALLHFATATAIVVYFWRDIYTLILSALAIPRKLLSRQNLAANEEVVLALVAGTIPAVILGLVLEESMATLFRNPLLVAGALIFGSAIMFSAERYTGLLTRFTSVAYGWKRGLIIGLFQSLALIPGTSRSGMTISAGMLFGMARGEAARFGFLLGVPLLLGAGAKKALELGIGEITIHMITGTVTAFIVALLVIHLLLKFLQNNTLYVFIVYRLLLAAGIVLATLLF
ncbi:undecaprenyl-diphosphate phosphatase [Candidatus Kaiserbacteria bacterium]|nr:MAG: undecaprenyl-diphosphate phosphatase [Candidatus Kaiserbacteria bacterium]